MDIHRLADTSNTSVGRGSPASLNDDEVDQTAGTSTHSQCAQAAIDGIETAWDWNEHGWV